MINVVLADKAEEFDALINICTAMFNMFNMFSATYTASEQQLKHKSKQQKDRSSDGQPAIA
jgi:hypothetical protein